jgi:hypothetical protein
MKIEQVNQVLQSPNLPTGKTEVQTSARDRAIAALLGNQTQSSPVQNPTRVSPEESSIVSPTKQNHNSEDLPSLDVPAPQATSEESTPISQQYAILARREKAIRMKEAQMRAREASLRQPASAPAPEAPKVDMTQYVPKDRLTQDPFTVLQEMGLTYDQLTELALNAPKPEQLALQNELKALREELKSLKGESDNHKKTFEQYEDQQYKSALKQIEFDVSSLVKTDPAFEAVRAARATRDVVNLIDRVYKEDGVLMTIEDAASEVETQLVEEAMKLARLTKVQRQLSASMRPQSSAAPQAKQNGQQQQSSTTLTNNMGSSKKLSARERALLAFEGKLQS